MKRFLLTAALLLFPMFAHAQSEEAQALVDRSTIALQEMMTQDVSHTPRAMLDRSRAVLICPRVFKAGFFFGGSGGNCVLLARAGNGTWSYPAFFTIGSASFGFQIGVQDSSLVLLVLTDRGLDALMNSHFKLGGDASIAIATIGAGVQGALTTGITADIVAFQATRGAFAGISVEGSVLNSRTDLDQAYYGRPLDTRQIVIAMQAANPGADPLRGVLTRYGAPASPAAAPSPPPGYAPRQPPGYPPSSAPQSLAPPQSGYQGAPVGTVQQQSLPPPR
ncbi:MAG TPA: lipid-binding SYLF domain-containing protein [Acetobacteraceae bacterium]